MGTVGTDAMDYRRELTGGGRMVPAAAGYGGIGCRAYAARHGSHQGREPLKAARG